MTLAKSDIPLVEAVLNSNACANVIEPVST